MKIKKYLILLTVGLVLLLLPKTVQAKSLSAQLNQPHQSIQLRENLSFRHTNYDINLNGKRVGYVSGDFFHPFGDTISIYDNQGNVIYSEHQKRRRFSFSFVRQGDFYDKNHEYAGSMREPFWQFFTKNFKLYNAQGQQVGVSTQNNWQNFLHHSYDIKTTDNHLAWQGRNSVHVIRDTVYLKAVNKSQISAEQAIIVTLVHQAVSHEGKKK